MSSGLWSWGWVALRVGLTLVLLFVVFLPNALDTGGAPAWLVLGAWVLLMAWVITTDVRRHTGHRRGAEQDGS